MSRPPAQQTVDVLSQDLRKNQEISWDSPLRIRCNTWKWAETGEFSWKMDLLSLLDEMSQESWTKNTRTKCHRLLDKILQWDGLSHCDKPSKFTRSECHNFGWTDNPSTLRRNVTVVKCHSRRFVGWTNSVGRNVTWSVCGWTDRQCTVFLYGESNAVSAFNPELYHSDGAKWTAAVTSQYCN